MKNKGKFISSFSTATMTGKDKVNYRAAIPVAISQIMGIEKGDKLLWTYDIVNKSLSVENLGKKD